MGPFAHYRRERRRHRQGHCRWKVSGHGRFRGVGPLRCHCHLRADALAKNERSRYFLHRFGSGQHAVDSIKQHICPPALIVLESTTYPGTTDELVVAELESVGLTLDQDFFACFSPERVDPGNALFQTRNIPKVVGGVSELSTKLGVTFYQQVLEKVHPVSSGRGDGQTAGKYVSRRQHWPGQ